jgi:hypothetical protein
MDAVETHGFITFGSAGISWFFTAMAPQKAHWYNVLPPTNVDPSRDNISRIFPPLSSLLNIEVMIMQKVLEVCGLCRRKGSDLLILENGWKVFIAEYKLDIELTVFTIYGKRHHFLRIGSFNKTNHPPMMPLFCWSKKVGPPKLRITKLTSIFAKCVGEMNIILNDRSLDSSDDDSSSDDESEVEPSDPEKKQTDRVEGTTDVYLPDPEKFPLLHSIGYNPMIMDRLMQEILLFHGNNRISFTRGNNRKGTLVIFPSHRK